MSNTTEHHESESARHESARDEALRAGNDRLAWYHHAMIDYHEEAAQAAYLRANGSLWASTDTGAQIADAEEAAAEYLEEAEAIKRGEEPPRSLRSAVKRIRFEKRITAD